MSTILIIDDDDQLRKSFEKLLIEEGYHTDSAPSGELGIDRVRKNVPDLVILDMRLPGMDGLTAIEHFREHVGQVPIVVITAYGDLQTAVEAVREPAGDRFTRRRRGECRTRRRLEGAHAQRFLTVASGAIVYTGRNTRGRRYALVGLDRRGSSAARFRGRDDDRVLPRGVRSVRALPGSVRPAGGRASRVAAVARLRGALRR